MEATQCLKRSVPVSMNLCIICQEDRPNLPLLRKTDLGLKTLETSTQQRQKYRDFKNHDTIDRIQAALSKSPRDLIVCHKNCYSTYTSKEKISRLEKANRTQPTQSQSASTSTSSTKILRSVTRPLNPDLCIFCQKPSESKLISIQTLEVSTRILEAAQYDKDLSTRLGIQDLVATEGKYHTVCHQQFKRNTQRNKDATQKSDLGMVWLCGELEVAAEHGDVLDLQEVWMRYCDIVQSSGLKIPPSFISRITTFRDKLSEQIRGIYDIIVLHDQKRTDNRTVLIPLKYAHMPISMMRQQAAADEEDYESNIPSYVPAEGDQQFLDLVHVALKIRSDILSHPPFKGLDANKDNSIDCIPDSLYMFLNLMLGGEEVLENQDSEDDSKREELRRTRILSIAQDLVYVVSKHLTPKHVGLGCSLHQATRSKQLVKLFHNAGHIMSYRDILRVDTALAEKTLESMDDNGSVIPPNLVEGRFVHFTTDNIDINEASLDGKNSFHATQSAAWQRGPAPPSTLANIQPSKSNTLVVPEVMNDILPAYIQGRVHPQLEGPILEEWFEDPGENLPSTLRAQAKDMVFHIKRHQDSPIATWTGFNKQHADHNPQRTSVGYLPIIQAPAHDLDTLNTVVQRIMHITRTLKQKHVVLTVDEALFPSLMELKWCTPEYKDILIPRIGGLHTSMNFLKAIGQHMADSGLVDVWSESGILGPNVADQIMSGKKYARAVRVHKLTLQALWQLLLPKLLSYLEEYDKDLKLNLHPDVPSDDPYDFDELLSILVSQRFLGAMDTFILKFCEDNPTAKFWWQYMQMVSILLLHIRAQRDGIWELHLDAFRKMLPYFFRYDHHNYARWGTVYLAQMHMLPAEVESEFKAGNFVVKDSNQSFNQVDPDHSQEWLNGTGKKGGGIIGITKTTSALSRWALSYNFRSQLSVQTREAFMCEQDDDYKHNESGAARMKRDEEDEVKVLTTFRRFNVFDDSTARSPSLQNVVTKDLATTDIEESLLGARQLGQDKLAEFVKTRLLAVQPEGVTRLDLKAPLAKNKPLTFASLYVVPHPTKTKETQKVIKVDRNILQRLITAYKAKRPVNLEKILQHELMSVPLSLASTDGSLHSANKSILADVLTKDLVTPPSVILPGTTALVIDGQALVMAIGKPHDVTTFGGYAGVFVKSVLNMGARFDRIDVTFDHYQQHSIKDGTRKKRTKGSRPIRRVVTDSSVPLPSNWSSFISLGENKHDLSELLTKQLIIQSPENKTIVVAGGLRDITAVKSSDPELDVSALQANHEEADTRLVLHCVNIDSDSIVVSSRDTDVLVLLIAHYSKMTCTQLWMKLGTSKKPRYIPIHEIHQRLPTEIIDTLLAFHAITGCDSVSQLLGHSKKTAWKVFQQHPQLLRGLGRGQLTPVTASAAETFICRIYAVTDVDTCDKARVKLFSKCLSQESLPPTTDAVHLHIRRAHYQTMVWIQADICTQVLQQVSSSGWTISGDHLIPEMMRLPPIPEACLEITSCGCSKGCVTTRCGCRHVGLSCTDACKCMDSTIPCRNTDI